MCDKRRCGVEMNLESTVNVEIMGQEKITVEEMGGV